MFRIIRLNPAHTSETALPLLLVMADPHRRLWVLKSPKRINGVGSREIRLISLATGNAGER
jgi:hypothetical protein